MSDAANPTSYDDAEALARAEQWGLEHRRAGDVAVDPRALSLLPGPECRRLRAVPLAATGSSAVVGVAEPSEERFGAVRAITGQATRFVVLGERTLEALLHSRMFAGAQAAAEPSPSPPPAPTPSSPPAPVPEPEPPSDPERPAAAEAAPAAARPPDLDLVDAIVAALEPRLAAVQAAPAPPLPAPAPAAPGAGGAFADVLAQVDTAITGWTALRGSLESFGEELEAARRSLREAKEQLSVAHAENDQHRRRVEALEAELAESRTFVEEARACLQEAAEALGAGTRRLEPSSELL